MYAIMTELDTQSAWQIEKIRSRAVAACGGDPVPLQWPLHLSWQGAESYALVEVEERMRMIAKNVAPIVTNIEGVGIFTGPQPVLHLPVTRTPELSALNETLWETLAPLAIKSNYYFSPNQWVPHITILYGNAEVTEAIACMVSRLLSEPLHINITLDHIYMGYFQGPEYGEAFRFPLLGKPDETQP
jgi:2'-5' RNA ligase